jgi:hypothetical protein
VVYADDVNVLCESLHIIKKNTEALAVGSKEMEIELVISRDQNAG